MKLTSDDFFKALNYPHIFGHTLGYTKLLPIHGEWIKRFLRLSPNEIYTMQAHRNAYKTTCGVVFLVLYFLLYPDSRVLIVRKTTLNALKVLQAVCRHFERDPVVHEFVKLRYGTVPIVGDVWSSIRATFGFRRKVLIEPSLTAVGVGTSITGSHFDLIWADDVVTRQDRESAAEREATKLYIHELHNLLDPTGCLLSTGTPWHADDAHSILPEPDRYPIGSIPIPDFTPKKIEQLKASMPWALWCANYELRHVEDYEPLFPAFNFVSELPRGLQRYWYIDPSFSGSDFTCIVEGAADGDLIYITWIMFSADSIGDLYPFIASTFFERDVTKIYFEANSAQILIGNELVRRGIPCEGVKNVTNKYARITGTLKPVWELLRFHKDLTFTAPAALEQIKSYNEFAEHDDAPDALAGIVSVLVDRLSDIDDILEVQRLLA